MIYILYIYILVLIKNVYKHTTVRVLIKSYNSKRETHCRLFLLFSMVHNRACDTPTIASCRLSATRFPFPSHSSPSSSRKPPVTRLVRKRKRSGPDPALGCALKSMRQLRVGTHPDTIAPSTGGTDASSSIGAAARVGVPPGCSGNTHHPSYAAVGRD